MVLETVVEQINHLWTLLRIWKPNTLTEIDTLCGLHQ